MEDNWDNLLAEVGKSLRGRPALPLSVGKPRALGFEDVILGADLRKSQKVPTSTPPELLKLRSRHHMVAQLLAMGQRPKDVAFKTGYSQSRISILQADPAFKELLSSYEAEQINLSYDVKERLRTLSMESIDLIQIRLDEDPEQFTNKELMTLAELSLDRTGHGKSSTVQVELGLDADSVALLKSQTRKPRIANLLEGELLDGLKGDLDGTALEEPKQLELFASGEDKTTGEPNSSQVYPGQAGDDPLRSSELSSEVRDQLSATVLENDGPENVVRFPGRNR